MTSNFWFRAVPSFFTTKTLKVMALSCLLVGVYTFAIIVIEREVLHWDFKPSPTIFSLMGLVLGLLLVFRTNTAYDRWWEGRRLLGQLNNQSRNLAIKLSSYLPKEAIAERTFFSRMIGNYAFALKEHLRAGVIWDELELDENQRNSFNGIQHIPNKITLFLSERVNYLCKKGAITGEQFLVLDKQLESFAEVVGGCERIRNTPIPFSYSVHLKKFLFLYMLILPFGIIHDMGYYSIILMMIVFYAFAGIEVIGEEIEDPFGNDVNDLPTDAISQRIRENVSEILLN
jgi:ion channel-forming bestrophin family protein